MMYLNKNLTSVSLCAAFANSIGIAVSISELPVFRPGLLL